MDYWIKGIKIIFYGTKEWTYNKIPYPFLLNANLQSLLSNFTTILLNMSIRIFVTGGTFDKEYNEITGQLYFKDSHLQEMLELGRCRVPVDIRTLMMVDSLEITDLDRELIAEHCNKAEEDKIIITHGTDTMADTASLLAQKVSGKTIVVTGAMIPYKFGSSDGLFNLGSALAFVQTLLPGVYVAMNGQYFAADNVRKNKLTGEFEEISDRE